MNITFNVKVKMSEITNFDNQIGFSSHCLVEQEEIERIKPVLAEYFSTDFRPSVEVVIETEIVSDKDLVPVERYMKDEHVSESLKCLLRDIKNEESYLFRMLAPSYQNLGIVDQKVEIACALFKSYIAYRDSFSSNMNDATMFYFHCDYLWPAYFRFFLPKSVVFENERCRDCLHNEFLMVELSKLSTEDLVKYVIPAYYDDLGMRDRESIRNNEALMDFLCANWLDFTREAYYKHKCDIHVHF